VTAPRPGPASVLALALLAALSGGVAVGTVLTTPGTPEVLAAGPTVTEVPVTTRAYDDRRNLALRVTAGAAREVTVRAGGLVTSSTCSPGGTLTSGGTTVTLDGVPLLDLHTAVPLWRGLSVGDRGPDVAALHDARRALGRAAPADDRVTATTLRSFHAATTAVGAPAPASTRDPVDPTRVVWLPEPTVTVGTCAAEIGADVVAGDALAGLPAEPASAALVAVPEDAAPGARALTIGGTPVSVGADGRITDPASLAVVAASEEYVQAAAVVEAGTDVTLNVPWALVEPVDVWVVPPGAVLGAGTDAACVRDADDRPVGVTVVASELGQTFVAPVTATAPPTSVRTRPTGGCA
jgi:hypothetical protein